MLRYSRELKASARRLRTNSTDAEHRLWGRLRRKQILGIQFYRQKPIGNYIVDFYAPAVRLIVEIDGSQHLEPDQARRDELRTAYFNQLGLRVLRFNDRQVSTVCLQVGFGNDLSRSLPSDSETVRDDPMLIIVIPREARNLFGSERFATESYH